MLNFIEKMFEHYIICRYNLTLFSDNVYKVKDPDGWMQRRRNYFNWLVVSLGAQTCKDFKFVVLMDKNTPEKYLNELKSDMSCLDNYEIFFGNPQKWVASKEFKTDWIITSRIDCDDYYFETFVEEIQKAFRKEEEVLDVRGVQYDSIGDEFYTSGRAVPNSPFISLVETTEDIKTIFCKPHTNMRDLFPARFVGEKELYVQVIHGENISNKIRGNLL